MNNVQNRRIRVRNIPFNPFLLNNGIIKKTSFIIVLITIFEIFLTRVLYIDYQFFTQTDKDMFEIMNKIGGEIFILNRYVVLHYLDEIIIDTYNSYLSDFNYFTLTIPKSIEYINYNNFELSNMGKIEIIISFIFTLMTLFIIILQIKEQQKLADIGLHSLYSPILLICFNYLHKDYIYLKRVPGLKSDNLNKDKEKEIIELFFSKSDLYKENNIEDLLLKKETKYFLSGFYNYYRFSIYLK